MYKNLVKTSARIRFSGPASSLVCLTNRKALLSLLLFSGLIMSAPFAHASEQLCLGEPQVVGMDACVLAGIDSVVSEAMESGKIPGCVVLVARKGVIVWERAYGYRSLAPEKAPNSLSTIYDLASLTKPVATATAFALLLEDGKLHLDDKVVSYLPRFARNGKSDVTIKNLLTHVSGLKAYLDMTLVVKEYGPGPDPEAIANHICTLPKAYETGRSHMYSCLNFVVLARIVEEIADEAMGTLLKRRVWSPLKMRDTSFFLTEEQRARAAPTRPDGSASYRGKVHDPLARYYITSRHCSGNAGLFSTARDLAIFAQMLLNRGSYAGVRVLKPGTVDLLTSIQSPPGLPKRGLGWDIDSPHAASVRGDTLPPDDSFGHAGFTGTSLWIDRTSQTFIIVLANRTHMEKGDVTELRARIATLVGRSIDIYAVQSPEEKPGEPPGILSPSL
jgi:CubicO group peptidase (beta-lactamase class C family)